MIRTRPADLQPRMTTAVLLLVVMALSSTAAGASDPEQGEETILRESPGIEAFSQEQLSEARAELRERLDGLRSKRTHARELGEIVLLERPGGAFEAVARERFWGLAPGMNDMLAALFKEAGPAARIEVLESYRNNWSTMGRGTSGARNEILRRGLRDDHQAVRMAAARLMASAPFPHMLHQVIDAAVRDPDLTLAAVLAVAQAREYQGCRWALRAGARDGGAVREAALMAFRRSGPKCKERVAEFLDSDDPEQRLLAAEGMLHVAEPSDAPRLREWAERWEDEHPEMSERLSAAADALEEDSYEPPAVQVVELPVDDES